MRKLFKLIVSLLVLAAVAYFVTMVPMGQKTIWQHLQSIAGTPESKELVEGVKKTAQEVIHKTTGEAGEEAGEAARKVKDDLTPDDRKKLRKLLKKLERDKSK